MRFQQALCMAMCAISTVACAQEVTVDGYVHDSSGKSLAGVKVGMYATGKKDPIEVTHSGENGYYKFAKKIDSTYDILYTHSKLDPACVELLAERRNQQISIKMYRRGEARPATAYQEQLLAAERWLFLIMSLEKDDRAPMLAEYKSAGTMAMIVEEPSLMPEASVEVRNYFASKRKNLVVLSTDLGGR